MYITIANLREYLGLKDTDTYTSAFATDNLTLSDVPFRDSLSTGSPVKVASTTNDPPDPLVEGTVYYVILGADQVIQLATTSANATAGTQITLTDDGTGTHSITKEDSDTEVLTRAVAAAQKYIEYRTHRSFEAVTATRYFDETAQDRYNSRRLLLLDASLLTVTTLTNGDSSSTVLAATDYWLEDRNLGPPYFAVLLKVDIDDYWQWDTDGWVSIAGTWGEFTTAPEDIQQATLVLAAYLFRQKDSQVFDTTAIPEAGVITIPSGIPKTVTLIIEAYRKRF